MSAVKFECPSCGQHMECDRACSGDVIHCVGCCAELRIPFSSNKTGLAPVERAELIVPGAAPSASSPSTAAPSPVGASASLVDVAKGSNSQNIKKPSDQLIETTCPVCQAHLRLDPRKYSNSDGPSRAAELVPGNNVCSKKVPSEDHQGKQQLQPNPSSQKDTGDSHHMSFEERERQIAEGRKAHPIQLYPAQKPRLEYILSGGATQPGKDQDHKPPSDQKQTGDSHPESFSE